MPKVHKPVPANLSTAERAKLKADILVSFPVLRDYEAELDYLVEAYNKDRSFPVRLMERADPAKALEAATQASRGVVKTIKTTDPEYESMVAAMDRAREEFLAQQQQQQEAGQKSDA